MDKKAFNAIPGRRITLAEATKIAREIMEKAERERLEIAQREAERGFQEIE